MPALSQNERILIVGGGMGGLAFGIAAHDRGFTVDVVERATAWPDSGALGVFHANGVRVLRALGLGDAVEAVGARLEHQTMRDQHGQLLCRTDLRQLWGDVGPTYGVDRPALQSALLSRAETLSCRLGVAVDGIEQADREVIARFADGSSDSYALIVGADGVSSTVRLELTDAAVPYGGEMYWRCVSPSPAADPTGVDAFFGDGCFFGVVPLRDGRAYGFGATFDSTGSHDIVDGRLGRMRQRFADFGGPMPDFLASLERDDQVHYGPTKRVTLPTWHRGRVVLIGDAAHATKPMMAEGCSMALEDALVLAEVLATSADVESALASYEARRMPRVQWVQDQTDLMAKGFGMPPAVRNAFLTERGDAMTYERFGPLVDLP